MKRVNSELMLLYWEISEEIDRKQRDQCWGKSVVEILSKELQKEFPGVQGFSTRNLWLMRSFYLEYSEMSNLQPMVAENKNVIFSPKVAYFPTPILAIFYMFVDKAFSAHSYDFRELGLYAK